MKSNDFIRDIWIRVFLSDLEIQGIKESDEVAMLYYENKVSVREAVALFLSQRS